MDRNVSFPLTTGRRTLGFRDERSIREAVFGSKNFVQRMKLDRTLDVHRGCVNTICWNERGSLILSGSDDKKLCMTNPYSKEVVASIPTGHKSNIFSAKFLPATQDRQVISCSGDGCIIYSDVEMPEMYSKSTFNCHYGTAYEVVTLPSDPHTFLSCGEDGTVRWFDLRRKSSCSKEECREDVMINCRRAVTGACVNPVMPYHLAVGCSDSSVRVFDRRMLGTRLTGNHVGRGIQGILCRFCPSHLQNKYSRPTSLSYSANGQDLLVSYASDYIYLFGTNARYQQPSGEMLCGGRDDGLVEEDIVQPPSTDRNELTAPGAPVKRLRLRGDWSDTGPRARPRSELPEEERPQPTMIQRMSEMLSRWLEDSASRPRPPGARGQAGSPSSSSASASSSHLASPSSIEEGSQVDVRARIMQLQRSSSSSGAGPSSSGAAPSNSGAGPSKIGAGPSSSGAGPSTSGAEKKLQTDGGGDDGAKTKGEQSVGKREGEDSAIVEENREETDRRKEGRSPDTPGELSEGASSSSLEQRQSSSGDSSAGQRSKVNDPKGDQSPGKEGQSPDSSVGRKEDATEVQAKMSESKGDESKDDSGGGEDDGGGRKEDEKKGIFALGSRMEDRNPQPRLTKQDSLEHPRSRKKSIVDAPPSPIQPETSDNSAQSIPSRESDREKEGEQAQASSSQAKGMGKDEGGDEKRRGEDDKGSRRDGDEEGGKGKGEEQRKEGKEGSESAGSKEGKGAEGGHEGASSAPTTPSDTTHGSSVRSYSESSQSMTCSESESEKEMQVAGAEGETKPPSPKPEETLSPPKYSEKELARKAARQKLRDLFKARKDEEKEIKNIFAPAVEMVYKGHRNSRTMIKEASFWGDHYIISGSDCGHIFIWDRYTAELVMLLEGDKHVVNCIQPHPFDPLLATSGIDYNVKLWSPIATEACLPDNAAEVMRINELMLEETRDTITVPPSFMLRMLASINHLRGDRRRSEGPQTSDSSDE